MPYLDNTNDQENCKIAINKAIELSSSDLVLHNKLLDCLKNYNQNCFMIGSYFFVLKDLFIRNFNAFLFFDKNELLNNQLKTRFLNKIIDTHFVRRNFEDINLISKFLSNNKTEYKETQKILFAEIIKVKNHKNSYSLVALFKTHTYTISLFKTKHKKMFLNILDKHRELNKYNEQANVFDSISNF